MQSKTFTQGRIRRADFDPAGGHLELAWDNGRLSAYKAVPAEVYRRLCSAPNPTTYWEDRIAEEYAKAEPRGKPAGAEAARKGLSDLLGGVE